MWLHSQKVLSFVVYREHFGVWAYLSPVNNWLHLAPNDDDGLINMTTLAAHAKGFDRFVDAYVEGDQIRTLVVY